MEEVEMNKIICHQSGALFIKCTKCEYSWNVPVVMHQEVEPVCPNCGNNDGKHLEAVHKTTGHVDIPEFMAKPKEVVTIPRTQLDYIIADNYELGLKAGFKKGKQKGLSIGISIGLVIMGIVLFFLFAPFSMLPV